MSHWLRIGILSIAATAAEIAYARFLSPIWILSHPALFVVETPIAQWVDRITVFGLSWLLYLAVFSVVPQMDVVGWKRWRCSLVGCVVVLLLWVVGKQIEASIAVDRLPFSVALVQPHLRHTSDEIWEPWRELIRLTDELVDDDGDVDLIVWPENSLSASDRSKMEQRIGQLSNMRLQSYNGPELKKNVTEFDMGSMVGRFGRQSAVKLLAGCVLLDVVRKENFGLDVPQVQRMNCACLWDSQNAVDSRPLQVHAKLALIPLREYVPAFLCFEFVRNRFLSEISLDELTPGEKFQLLEITDSNARKHQLAVAICYESWLPWLPQYRTKKPVIAICHLIYDGDFAGYTAYTDRMLASIRLRAIETRTWQLVCSCWAGSAIIDPRGRIVAQLTPVAGVLRNDHSIE